MSKFKVGEHIELTMGMIAHGMPDGLNIKSKAMPRKDLEYGQVDVIVSNNALDRHGERIVVQGIDAARFRQNPGVLWGHDYSGLPIGMSVKEWNQDGNFMSRTQFATKEYPFAETVYKMVVGGFINAVSIGGIVRELDPKDDTIIKSLEMVEYSFVPVGANPEALVVGKSFKKSLGVDRKTLETQYNEFMTKAVALDKLKGLSDNVTNKYINSLKELLSLLESVKPQESIETRDEPIRKVKHIVLVD